jgi:hypothetical protein
MGRLSRWIERSGRVSFAALVIGVSGCNRPESGAPVVSKTPAGQSRSPSGAQAAHEGKSLVRLVNALPDTPSMSVLVGDSVLFARVLAATVTPYREVRDNSVTIRVRDASNRVVAQREETMADGFRYTVIALPEKTGIELRVLQDEVVPDVGKARIRFINASPNASVDLAVGAASDPLFSDVGPGDLAGYRDIDPASSTLEIRDRSQRGPSVEIPEVRLAAGKAYTIVLVGRSNGGLDAITFDDSVSDPKLSLRDGTTR